jgi:hypothetical protein
MREYKAAGAQTHQGNKHKEMTEDRHSFEYSLSKHNKGRNTKWNMKTKQNDIGQKDPEHSRCRAKKKNYSEE